MKGPLPEITVTNRRDAGRILTSHTLGRQVDWLVSLGGESSKLPDGWVTIPSRRKVRLVFDDIEYPHPWYTPPGRDDIKELIEFVGEAREGRMLVHCAAGVSRSSASAILALAVRYGEGNEHKAADTLWEMVDTARQRGLRDEVGIHPNRRILWLGDELLGREGRLFEACCDVFREVYPATPFEFRE